MDVRKQIIKDISSFLDISGFSKSRLGEVAVDNHKFIFNIEAGKGVSLLTVERLYAFMEDFVRKNKRKRTVWPSKRYLVERGSSVAERRAHNLKAAGAIPAPATRI